MKPTSIHFRNLCTNSQSANWRVLIVCVVTLFLWVQTSAQILIHEQQFEGGTNGWIGQSYTSVGNLTASPTWGWIVGVNWPLFGGAEGSFRHNVPFESGAWFAWSPAISLEVGEEYYVQFGAALSSANNSNRNRAQVRVNTSTDLLSAQILLPSTDIITSGSGVYNDYTSTIFTAPATAEYRFAVGDFFNADGFACYVDGIRIYKVSSIAASLVTGDVDDTSYCVADPISVEYTASGSFSPGNIFTLELSDALGDFTNPTVLATLESQVSGTISGMLPSDLVEGTAYRVRVQSSAPVLSGGVNEQDLSIGIHPVVDLGGDIQGCEGDLIELDAGFPEAEVSWSNGQSGNSVVISEGALYTVIVTLPNGCSGSDQVLVTIGDNTSSLLAPQYVICIGETVVLNAGDFATIEWSNGEITNSFETGLPGDYFFEGVNELGCVTTGSTEVMEGEPIEVDLGSDQLICAGQSLILEAPTGNYTYQWSTDETTSSIAITQEGSYSVIVSSNDSCSGYDEVYVEINPLPEVDLGPDVEIEEGETVQLNAGPGFVQYEWSTGASSQIIQVMEEGTFSVTVTDGNGCQGADEITVSVITSVNELMSTRQPALMPNPASDFVRVVVSDSAGGVQLTMFDQLGRPVRTRTIWTGQTIIDLSDVAAGLYFLRFCSGQSVVAQETLVISR